MKRAYEFYAMRQDMLALLNILEAARPLQYIEVDLLYSNNPVVKESARDIDDLGIAKYGKHVLEPIYMVMDLGSPVVVRDVPQRKGGIRYSVGPGENPKSVTLCVGGEYRDEALIAGQMGTVSTDPDAVALFQLFGNEIRRTFKKVRSYWLGEKALHALASGMRLTPSVKAPSEFDLKLE